MTGMDTLLFNNTRYPQRLCCINEMESYNGEQPKKARRYDYDVFHGNVRAFGWRDYRKQ